MPATPGSTDDLQRLLSGNGSPRHVLGDQVDRDLMRANIRARLFGDEVPPALQIGPFSLRRAIGRGGMGVVFAAYDRRLHREVALKLVAAGRHSTAAELLSEARAIAAIEHDNVVPVYSAGRCTLPGDRQKRVYIAMELLRGQTLQRWVASSPVSAREVVEAYRQAAAGLGAAHQRGIVHGDFKPQNAMISGDGRVRVMDFGLAVHRTHPSSLELLESIEASDSDVTPRGPIAGTPAYLAPERLDGCDASSASDQWSLCIALFEALAGRLPHPRELARPLRLAGVPRGVARVLRRGLDADPTRRFETMEALSSALARPLGNRHTRWVVVASSVALAGVTIASMPADRSPCQNATSLDATWNDETRAALRPLFVVGGVEARSEDAEAVSGALDDFSRRWSAAKLRLCETAREEPMDPLADRTWACLERHRRAFIGLVDGLLAGGSDQAARARGAIGTFASPQTCGHEDSQWPYSGEPRVERVREDLAAAVAGADLGTVTVETFVRLQLRARALDRPLLVAEVDLARYMRIQFIDDPAEAAAALERAYAIATEHHLDGLAHDAAAALALVEVNVLRNYDGARRWLSAAGAARAALGARTSPSLRETEVELELELASGRLDRARDLAERRVVLSEGSCPPDCLEAVTALRDLVAVLRLTNDVDEAFARAGEAYEFAKKNLGERHPATIDMLYYLGLSLSDLGHSAEAIQTLERVVALDSEATADGPVLIGERFALAQALRRGGDLEVARAALVSLAADAKQQGLDHFAGMATAELAATSFQLNDVEAALAADIRAYVLLESVHGPDFHQLPTLLNNHSIHLAAAGRHEEALEAAERAWEMWQRASPEPTAQDAAFLANVGRHRVALGRSEDALEPLEAAVQLTENGTLTGPATSARIGLALALTALGREREARAHIAATAQRCARLEPPLRAAAKCTELEHWDNP